MVTQSAHFHNEINATHLTLYNNEIMTAYDLKKIISNGNPFLFSFFMVTTTLSIRSLRLYPAAAAGAAALRPSRSPFVAGHTLPISLGVRTTWNPFPILGDKIL